MMAHRLKTQIQQGGPMVADGDESRDNVRFEEGFRTRQTGRTPVTQKLLKTLMAFYRRRISEVRTPRQDVN
jgi:hypothetical protein